jgi:hypothetical protein
VSDGVTKERQLGRHIATVAVAVVGLLVALAGLGVINDHCQVACGTAADQRFREWMGYVGLVSGAFAFVLALRGRRVPAAAACSVGAIACFAAFAEGMSHLR